MSKPSHHRLDPATADAQSFATWPEQYQTCMCGAPWLPLAGRCLGQDTFLGASWELRQQWIDLVLLLPMPAWARRTLRTRWDREP